MASQELGIGTKIMAGIAFLIIAFGLISKCNQTFNGDSSANSVKNPFSCGVMEKFTSDDEVLNALNGTWIMENEDYYGKYKIQFSGRGATTWKMETGTTEWKEHGTMTLEEIKKYEHNTKMNQGPEYHISYTTELGGMSFDINCISGLTIASDRYPEYGIAFIKQ